MGSLCKRRSVGLAVLAVMALVGAMVFASPHDARAVTLGTVSGVVRGVETSAPVQGVEVVLYRWVDIEMAPYWEQVATATAQTDAAGAYSISVAPGIYRVSAREPFGAYPMTYFSFSGNSYSIEYASDIVVTEGANVTGVDFMLSWSGFISGTVTAEGGNPIANVPVRGWLVDHIDEFGVVWTSADYIALTNEFGQYSLQGLPAGQYRVYFPDPQDNGVYAFFGEWFNNVDRIEYATDVSVAPSATAFGIDAALTPCSTITGRVTTGGSTPVGGVLVEFESYDPVMGEWWWHGSTETAADGTYSYDGLSSGAYRVRFNGGGWVPAYLEEYYNDAVDAMSATDVVVGTGVTVPNIDADLAPAGRITGVVTGAGQPLSAVTVPAEYTDPGLMVMANVYRWNTEWLGWESIRSDVVDPATGGYDVGGLPTGTYRVRFEGDGIGFFPFVPECYSGAAIIDDAQDIVVTAGAVTSGIDADLALGGTVSGVVTDGSGVVSDAWADVYRWNGMEWESYCGALNGADGSYTIYGLPAGTYRIGFSHPSGTYLTEFYGGVRTVDAATDVVVSAGASGTGIDAQLDPAGTISGNVTSGGGTIFDTELVVEAYRWNSTTLAWEFASETFTCDYYTIGGLTSGTYRVRVYAMGGQYMDTYYGGTRSIDTATDVTVVEGSNTGGIDIDMPLGGRITGMVVGATGVTIAEDLEALAYRWNGSTWVLERWAGAFLDEYYTIGNLPAGRYKVVFRDWRGVHAREYYNDAVDLGDAVEFDLALGQTISGVDAQLGYAGHITGTVTGPSSEPYENITVTAWRWDSGLLEWDALGETITGADGTYAIDGLPSGTYHVYFDDWTGESQGPRGREFYNDVNLPFESGVASSTDVVVVQGSTTPNIDAQLGSLATDTVAPVTTAFVSETGWTRNDVTLELSAVDAGSGVGATYYAIDGGAPQLYVMPIVFQNEGISSIEYWSVDSASNAEASRTVTVSIDRSAPITNSDAQASYQGGATITLSATDAISGVSETLWSLDGAAPGSGTTVTTDVIGSHTIDYLSMDFAGNIEPTRTVVFEVTSGGSCGSSAEIVPATPDGSAGWYRTQPSVYVTATPPGGFVGAPNSFVRIDSGSWTTVTAPVSVPAGVHVVSYYSEAGATTSSVTTMTVRYDGVRPSRPGTMTASSVSPTGFKVAWPAVTDSGSGVAGYTAVLTGGIATKTVEVGAATPWVTFDHLTANTSYLVRVYSRDVAGNVCIGTSNLTQSTSALVGGADIPSGSPNVTLPGGGSLDFSNVTTPGAVYVTPIDPRTDASDENFRIVHGAYFDIHVEAGFTGEVILTLPYDETQLTGWSSGNATQREAIERSLKLKHRKADGGWEDITISVDTVANTITGRTTSFSDFWIEEPVGSGNWVLVSGSTALSPVGAAIVVAGFAFVVVRRRNRMAA